MSRGEKLRGVRVQQGLAAGDDDVGRSQPTPYIRENLPPLLRGSEVRLGSAVLPDVAMHAPGGAAHGEHDDDGTRLAVACPAPAADGPQRQNDCLAEAPW